MPSFRFAIIQVSVAAAAALLCLAAATLWVRGYYVGDFYARSWQALDDAYAYGLLRAGVEPDPQPQP